MGNTFRGACSFMLSFFSQLPSVATFGELVSFGASTLAVGAIYCVAKGGSTRSVSAPETSKTSFPDDSYYENRRSRWKLSHVSDGSHAKTSREPSSEYTSTAFGPFTSQNIGTVFPLSSGNPASGGAFSGKRQPVESSVAFSTSTFCLSLDEGVIKELFDKMHGKYFHKRTSLEQFTYVLTGKGKKPEGVISIEWIASPRSFSLFIGIVCAPYRDKWKICKGLFTGNINKNPSCDFNRMVSHDLVKNNKVSSTLKENARFISEKDNDLKSLLVLLSGFPTF